MKKDKFVWMVAVVFLIFTLALLVREGSAQDPQKRLMTKRAARVDALRNLTEIVHGVKIDASTTVNNFVTQSDEVKAKVSAVIQGAEEIDYKENPDGTAEVTVEIPTDTVEKIIGRKLDYEYKTIRATGYGAPPGVAAPVKSEAPPQKSVVRVKGYGLEPTDPAMTGAEKALLGKRAAKVDALRNLLEQVYGVKVKSETTVRDLVTQSDEIRAKVNTFVQGARLISEKRMPDGSYEAEVELEVDSLKQIISK